MATTAEESKYDDYNFPHTDPAARTGHPGNLDDIQQAKVHQLRELLKQAGYTERLDTNSLLRFLRARKFDVQLALAMFQNTEKWRKEVDLDDNVKNFNYTEKPEVFKYYPQYYHKTDKDGRPLYIERLGKVDIKALLAITKEERMLTNLAVEYEKLADPRLPACSRKTGKLLETCCTIFDLQGVSLLSAPSVYPYLKKASVISQDHYPERLGKLYVINAPWGFSTVFNIVKGFLDPVTVEKIHVYGSGYKTDLLAQVPAENLPKMFGGACECEGGCELSDAGPWNDPQYQGAFFKSYPSSAPTATTTAEPAAPAPVPTESA